jgi:hypothetical protein
MEFIKYIFSPNFETYEGVRPIHIYILRFLYFLMLAFVATDAWGMILNHEGQIDRFRGMALSVWAAYATLSVFGLLQPLRWLPIVLFMIFYKTLWLIVVALPLWRVNELVGSPAEEMASIFIAAPFLIVIVPWNYVFTKFVLGRDSR